MKIIQNVVFHLILIAEICCQGDDDEKDPKRLTLSGHPIGTNLYHSSLTTQAMKRPQKWFFNVFIKKPNEKFFKEAEYNGLRYQTELLQDKLENEYNRNVKEFYDERLNVMEQKLINRLKITNGNKNGNNLRPKILPSKPINLAPKSVMKKPNIASPNDESSVEGCPCQQK